MFDGQANVVINIGKMFPTVGTPGNKEADCLQRGAVDNLHLDSELTASVGDDQDTNGAAASGEGATEAVPEAGLVNDGQASLDLTGLGHADDNAVLHVKNTVLLHDRAKHGLDDHTGGRVGDEGRLLVQLLGEQVDTQVAVLASGVGGRDPDNLARTALEHEDVTHADVVARNGDSVGDHSRSRGRSSGNLTDDLYIMVMVVVRVRQDLVSRAVETLAKGVVLTWKIVSRLGSKRLGGIAHTVFVVVTHLGLLRNRVSVTGVLGRLVRGGELNVLGVVRNSRRGVDCGSGNVGGGSTVSRASGGSVDGSSGNRGSGGAVGRTTSRSVDGRTGYVGSGSTVDRAAERRVDGSTGNVGGLGLVVVGLDASAVLTFDVVNSSVLGAVSVVYLDGSLRVGRLRSICYGGQQGRSFLQGRQVTWSTPITMGRDGTGGTWLGGWGVGLGGKGEKENAQVMHLGGAARPLSPGCVDRAGLVLANQESRKETG